LLEIVPEILKMLAACVSDFLMARVTKEICNSMFKFSIREYSSHEGIRVSALD
jgi:hypothetical protein